MPSLQQIKPKQSSQTSIKSKNSNIKKYLKIAVGIVIAGLAYMYYVSAKVINISDDVYAMHEESHFKELFNDPYKKVIWFGANCPVSQYKKNVIDAVMKRAEFDKYYIHHPFLQDSLLIKPADKLGFLIMDKCSGYICIIVPSSHKIIQTTEKHLMRDLAKYRGLL